MKLIPGKLYNTKASEGLFYKRHGDPICDFLIIPVNQVLLFVREERIMKDEYYINVTYFLYGHRIVYDHRYNTEQVACYLEELT